ncbi:spermine oxidase-like [Brachyhypopomus gauderio]|uniref:spermine oxidase-like n=1 Tax=Brachyhypopomus gauderio TaxID=698409 RepID=UPI004041310D
MSETSTMSKDATIVVVGAGFAGLSAASSLLHAGFQNVKVLEANARVGGRVCTTKPFKENVIELGANWIHGQQKNPVFQLAKKHNLLAEKSLLDRDKSSRDYFFKDGGKHLSEDLADPVTSLFEKLLTKANEDELGRKYRDMSRGDYLDVAFAKSRLAGSEDGSRIFEWCKRNECSNEAASSLFEVAASQLSEYSDLGGEFYNPLGSRGYQAILDILLKGVPSEIILTNKPVKRIQWDLNKKSQGAESREMSHPVKIICENDETFEADHVIVTVSLGVLKRQAGAMFEPGLPKCKMDAIETLGFGTVDKIFLRFSKRFWPEDCAGIQLVWDEGPEDKAIYDSQNEGDGWKKTWFKKICGFDTVARHPTVLCGWITGREALHMETLQDSDVRDTCVKLLRSFTGWSVPEVSQVLISRWGHDPRVFGSYSYIPKRVNGVRRQKALGAALPDLEESEPLQVLFAGEATHVNFYATTHGAYLSGIREAQRLINHYIK